ARRCTVPSYPVMSGMDTQSKLAEALQWLVPTDTNLSTCTIDFGHAHNYRGKHRSTVLDTLFGDFCGTDCQNTEP
ncbi:MAG: hypothetical protein WCJ35_27930, partial [Planctomycetota bacterium]